MWRRMKRTVSTRLIGMMMDAGHELMAVRIVMILAFVVRQIVLRFLGCGAHPAD